MGGHNSIARTAEVDYNEKFFLPSKIRKKILRMGREELSFRVDGQKMEKGYALVASVLFILNSYCVSTTVPNVSFI